MICSNKILAGVEFILFLNKLDILDQKLKSGIQFSSFVTSYTSQPNETKPVAKCTLYAYTTHRLQLTWAPQTSWMPSSLSINNTHPSDVASTPILPAQSCVYIFCPGYTHPDDHLFCDRTRKLLRQ